MIVNTLKRHRPALSWRADNLKITAGVSWVTFAITDTPKVRVSGKDELGRLRLSLAALLQGQSTLLAPGLAASFTSWDKSDGLTLEHSGGGVSRQTGTRGSTIYLDLLDWLELLHRGPLLPIGDGYHGANFENGFLYLQYAERKSWRVPVGDPHRLGRLLLAPGEDPTTVGELTICATDRRVYLLSGGTERTISRTAAAHLAGLLLADNLPQGDHS